MKAKLVSLFALLFLTVNVNAQKRALTRVPEMLEVDPNNPDPNQK